MCKVEMNYSDDNEEHSDEPPIPKKRQLYASSPAAAAAQSMLMLHHQQNADAAAAAAMMMAGNGGVDGATIVGSDDAPSLSINNVAATLDILKQLKNGQFAASAKPTTSTSSISLDEINGSGRHQGGDSSSAAVSNDLNSKILLDMQNKEHIMRMEILQVQLQTAKYNRDAAEINKMIAMRNLSIAATSSAVSAASAATPSTASVGSNEGSHVEH